MAEIYRAPVPTQVLDEPVHSIPKAEKSVTVKCFNAQQPDEMSNLFTGVTCVANEIIVCDHENKNVKRFKLDGALIGCLTLTNPCGISAISKSNEVVITEPDIRQLTFCSLDGAMKVSSVSRTSKKYECIRALDELKFVVGCCELGAPSVDFIDPHGNVLRSIKNTTDGNVLFRHPAAISCLTSGEILISDPGSSLLICISCEGKTVFKYDPMGRPSGICVDQYGGIYMAQYDSNMVYRLSADGNKDNVIVKDEINIRSPLALAVSSNGQYLVLTEDVPSERIIVIKVPLL